MLRHRARLNKTERLITESAGETRRKVMQLLYPTNHPSIHADSRPPPHRPPRPRPPSSSARPTSSTPACPSPPHPDPRPQLLHVHPRPTPTLDLNSCMSIPAFTLVISTEAQSAQWRDPCIGTCLCFSGCHPAGICFFFCPALLPVIPTLTRAEGEQPLSPRIAPILPLTSRRSLTLAVRAGPNSPRSSTAGASHRSSIKQNISRGTSNA